MLDYVATVYIYFFIQGKERPAKTKLFPAKFRAVLVLACAEVNFAHRYPAWSLTPHSLSHRFLFEKYSKFFEISSYGS